MASEPLYQPITVDQFLDIDFATDRRFELVDGVIRMMTGGTPAHARVSGNIQGYLHGRLRGSGCRAYGPDMGIRVDETNCRYPDVSVFCGNPATPDRERLRVFTDPVAVFEVLSPSTADEDQKRKLAQYRSLPSVDTIVFVDPVAELSRVVQRLGPATWRDDLLAQSRDIVLPALDITIPHADIFDRD